MSVCTRCWRAILDLPTSRRVSAHYATRAFSETARRPRARAQLPVFAESSTPELSELFQTIREKILIPSFLKGHQRDLVFKEKWRSTVENEDLTADIGDEVVPLRHISYKDIPKTKPAIMKAIELSKSEEDWENVLKLFEGLRQSRKGVGNLSRMHAKFVRHAIDEGMLNLVMRAVGGVEATGVSLRDANVLQHILIRGIHQRSIASAWTPEATEEAFERVMRIIQMMERPGHMGNSRGKDADDARMQPWVMGVLLEATVMRQKVLFDGKDHEGLVALYMQRLLGMGQERLAEWFKAGADSASPANLRTRISIRKEQARMLIPLWHGLGVTEEILGPSHDSIREARDFRNHVGQLIQEAVDFVIRSTDMDKAELLQSLRLGSVEETAAWENFL